MDESETEHHLMLMKPVKNTITPNRCFSIFTKTLRQIATMTSVKCLADKERGRDSVGETDSAQNKLDHVKYIEMFVTSTSIPKRIRRSSILR